MAAVGAEARILLFGGAALAFEHDARGATKDLDVLLLGSESGYVRLFSSEISKLYGIEDDWINDDGSRFVTEEIQAAATVFWRLPGLTILTPPTEALLAMKILSMRIDSQHPDSNDIIFLLRKLGWEPKVPSVASRIETLRKVASVGIDTMVAVRPLLPDVAKNELDEIVDATKDYAFGYYSGPLYLKQLSDDTITAEELSALGCTVSKEIEDVKWMPEGNRFLTIEAPELMAYLKGKVERFDRVMFEGAADGMGYLKRNRYAQH